MRGPPTAKSFITQHKYCTFRHRNWSWLELIEEIQHAWRRRPSIVIALLADGKRDGKPVALRRERAGRVGSVSTRGVFKAIEIEHELAGFIEAVGGEAGIEKAAGAVSGRGTGRVAKNEEKLCDGGVLEDGVKPKCFSPKTEFRGAGHVLIVGAAEDRDQGVGLFRGMPPPTPPHTLCWHPP